MKMTAEVVSVVKIVPSPEDLHITTRKSQLAIPCSIAGCNYVASNASMLGLHKAKLHKIMCVEKGKVHNYHCPVLSCYFNVNSVRHFKTLDALRTHYMKLHSEKKFLCKLCNKAFGLERDCLRHEKECGEIFTCEECGKICSSRSTLVKHCDYKGHKKPKQLLKLTTVQSSSKEGLSKKQDCETGDRKYPVPILPKSLITNVIPLFSGSSPEFLSSVPLQQQSLDIQTDMSRAQHILTKLSSERSVTQAVQTVGNNDMKRTACIQTTLGLGDRLNIKRNRMKLSTGIQTKMPHVNLSQNLCAAQTQTGESILQKAMTVAEIPVAKMCKGTQKSQKYSFLLNKQMCGSLDQAFSSTCGKRYLNNQVFVPILSDRKDKEVQMDLTNLKDFPSTISTQTKLTCLTQDFDSEESLNTHQQMLSQDMQTQTHSLKSASALMNGVQTIINTDQNTQTKLLYRGSDQNTQTHNDMCIGTNNYLDNISIQDGQSQTVFDSGAPTLINDNHTQTYLSSISFAPERHDQSTTCDQTYSTSLDVGGLPSLSSLSVNQQSNADPLDLTQLSKFHQQIYSDIPQTDGERVADFFDFNSPMEITSERAIALTESFSDLLSEVIDENKKSMDEALVSQHTSFPKSTDTFVTNREQGVKLNEALHESTFGTDCMTQTMEDLGWDMGTQTVEDLVSDMMTQTGDDLLEFLTSDIHTQTLDDFCDSFSDAGECSGVQRTFPTPGRAIQIDRSNQFEDSVTTQTTWDLLNDQLLDFPNNDFITSMPAPGTTCTTNSCVGTDTFEDTACSIYREGGMSVDMDTEEVSKPTFHHPRNTESSETQTIFDPFFYETGASGVPSLQVSRSLETSQTQTSFDPMLPIFSSDNILAVETQLPFQPVNPLMETAECQTSFQDFLSSAENSETQTSSSAIFNYPFVPSTDNETQTIQNMDDFSSFILTDSFTQTSLDQNTQTHPYDDMNSLFDL